MNCHNSFTLDSPRMRELISHIGNGLPDKEIASQMKLSYGTVKQYKTYLRGLMGVIGMSRARFVIKCAAHSGTVSGTR